MAKQTTLATVEITIYAPGCMVDKHEMAAWEEYGGLITQRQIDSWVKQRKSWSVEDYYEFEPSDVAKELPTGDYKFTDWGMEVDITGVDFGDSHTGDYDGNWIDSEISEIGMMEFLEAHLGDILEAACEVSDGLFKCRMFPGDTDLPPVHKIKFLSQWTFESWWSYVPGEPDEYDAGVSFDGRIDPLSLRVIEAKAA